MAILKIICPHCKKQMQRLDIPVCSGNIRPVIRGEFYCRKDHYRIFVTRRAHQKTILVYRPSRHKKKFTDDQVRYIREVLDKGISKIKTLAKHFGVDHKTITNAWRGRTYKHLREISNGN